jgi:hypothetical protein
VSECREEGREGREGSGEEKKSKKGEDRQQRDRSVAADRERRRQVEQASVSSRTQREGGNKKVGFATV